MMKMLTWRDLLTAGYLPPQQNANDNASNEIDRDIEQLERMLAAFHAARRSNEA